MDIATLYQFFFDTYAGVGCMIGVGILISIIGCVIMERRTRKTFVDRGEATEDDDWSFFDDDDDEED